MFIENEAAQKTLNIRKNCRFYINFATSKTEICGTLFKCYLHETEALRTPIIYMKINYFNIVLHMT